MEKKGSLIYYVFFIFAVVGVVSVIGLLCGSIYVFSTRVDDVSEYRKETYSYQYISRNYHEKETKVGMVTLPERMSETFSFREVSEGNVVLISEIGSEVYECTETCFCESSDYERRNSAGMSSTLRVGRYLLAALSSAVAYDLARDYFRTSCEDEYYSECEAGSSIRSKTDCYVLTLPSEDGTDLLEGDMSIFEDDDDDEEGNMFDFQVDETGNDRSQGASFFCKGLCTEVIDDAHVVDLVTKTMRTYGIIYPDLEDQWCGNIKLSGHVFIHNDYMPTEQSRLDFLSKRSFNEEQLQPFCRRSGNIEHFWKEINEKHNVEIPTAIDEIMNLCRSDEESIVCIQKNLIEDPELRGDAAELD